MQRWRMDKDEYVIPFSGPEFLHSFDALSVNKNLNSETFDRAKDAEDDEHPSFSSPYPLLGNNVSMNGMLDHTFCLIILLCSFLK